MRNKNGGIPSDQFNQWWDKDAYHPANPFEKGTPAFWAWEGWQAALDYKPPKAENEK